MGILATLFFEPSKSPKIGFLLLPFLVSAECRKLFCSVLWGMQTSISMKDTRYQEAFSHTVGEKPYTSLHAEAISHKTDEETIQQGRKRKGAASESRANPSVHHEGALDCIFLDDECIPLWPPY